MGNSAPAPDDSGVALSERIDTVFLPVIDLDDSIEWYTDVLGFDLRWRADDGSYAAIEIGETPLTLFEHDGAPLSIASPDSTGDEHELLNFYTADIESVHERLRERDLDPAPITDFPGIRTFRFSDPSGNCLAFCEYD